MSPRFCFFFIALATHALFMGVVEASSLRKSAHARFVPERKDDFAFENDKVAFRLYGPALKNSAEDNGIDCWLKRVSYPIIDKWYANNALGKSYHKDHGEGYDPYHVGSSLGCGGLGLWINGKLVQSNVFKDYKIIQNGPNKVVFEITYVWDQLQRKIQEKRVFTLELGSQLFRADSRFTINGEPAQVDVAIGVATHDGKAITYANASNNWVAAWEQIQGAGLGTAVILSPKYKGKIKSLKSEIPDRSHILILASTNARGRISYYAGFGWETAGEITSPGAWKAYLNTYVTK